jgi:hypothetical protein
MALQAMLNSPFNSFQRIDISTDTSTYATSVLTLNTDYTYIQGNFWLLLETPYSQIKMQGDDIFIDTSGSAGTFNVSSNDNNIDSSNKTTIKSTNGLFLTNTIGSGYTSLVFGTSAVGSNNYHMTSDGAGSFQIWRGNLGAGTRMMQIYNAQYFEYDRPIVVNAVADGGAGIRVWDTDGVDTNTYAYYAAYANDTSNAGGPGSTSSGVYSVICSGRVKATEFNATSDARIKNVVSSSKQEDVSKFKQINVVNYELFADHRDYDTHKGVLAQELELLYPAAVKLTEDYVPDIYKLCKILLNNGIYRLELANHGLNLNDNILIITPTKKIKTNITNIIDNNKFEIDSLDECLNVEEAFIYGKYVKDFRTVNYNELVSATIEVVQELLKKQEEQETKINSILSRLETLENK